MNAIQVFSYNGNKITFDFGNGIMTNATEMAKVFNKEPYGWLRLTSTRDFLWTLLAEKYPKSVPHNLRNETPNLRNETELSQILNSLGLIKIVQGGNSELQGTWFNDDITIEFARWLAPVFAIWCNDRIKEMLKGSTKFPTTSDEAIAYGYGKALEKINRQSTIIARQSKQLQKYKAQLESEIAARKMKRLASTQERRDERISLISDWLNVCNLVGFVSLAEMKVDFYEYCKGMDMTISVASSTMGKILKSMGLESLRRGDGMYYILKNQL